MLTSHRNFILSWIKETKQPHKKIKVDWFGGWVYIAYRYTPPPSLRPWSLLLIRQIRNLLKLAISGVDLYIANTSGDEERRRGWGLGRGIASPPPTRGSGGSSPEPQLQTTLRILALRTTLTLAISPLWGGGRESNWCTLFKTLRGHVPPVPGNDAYAYNCIAYSFLSTAWHQMSVHRYSKSYEQISIIILVVWSAVHVTSVT